MYGRAHKTFDIVGMELPWIYLQCYVQLKADETKKHFFLSCHYDEKREKTGYGSKLKNLLKRLCLAFNT